MFQSDELYENDFFGWTTEQANLLKTGELEKLDIENLMEEIESLGRSEKRALKSYLVNLLLHLLKSRYQPEKKTWSWELSIRNSRDDFLECLDENPSLKPKLDDILISAYRSARRKAEGETGLDENVFPEICPWGKEDLIWQ